jgi:uncharacterized protein involved in outer membrane biogenesis
VLKSRARRLLSWLLLALVLLWLAAWLALPPLLKWQLEKHGTELLGRPLQVGEVQFSPATLQLTLRNLSLAGADGAPPQAQIERLFIDLDMRSFLRLSPVVQALQVDAPKLRLARLAEGRYDIDDLLQRLAPKPDTPPREPARFALFNLRLAGGEFTFDDQPVARSHALREIVLDLPFLSNLPADVQIQVEPRLAFSYNDSRFDNQGRSMPFAKGRVSEFHIRFDKLSLAPLWAYAPATLPVRPAGGQLSADIQLRFEQPDQGDPRVDVQGALDLADMRVQPPGAAADVPLLAWRNLHLKLASLQPYGRTVAIDELRVEGAVLHVRRHADGQLQLQQLAPKPAPDAPSVPTAAGAPASAASGAAAVAAGGGAWQVKLDTLRLDDARVHWLDAVVQPAADLQLDGITLQLSSLSWPMRSDAQLQFEAALLDQGRKAGQLRASGPLTDRQARIDVALAGIDLGIIDPYLRPYLQVQASARLDAAATLDWASGDAPRLALAMPSLRVDELRLVERAAAARPRPAQAAPLAQLARLDVTDLRADLLQRQVSIGMLSLQKPFADLARDADGRLNASRWLVEQENTAPAPLAERAAAAPWSLQLREARLEGGRLRYADAALDAGPLELSNLRLQAQGLAWPLAPAPLATQASATLSLPGQRDGSTGAPPARLDWRGRVGLQPASADGTLMLQRFPVHVFEPLFGDALPVQLQRLEVGLQGQLQARQTAQGLAARIGGDALLADLRVLALDAAPTIAAGAPAELLSWNALNLNGLKLNLQPGEKPAIEIRELRLADFFARLEVSEEGRFNLQTVAAGRGAASAAAATPAEAPAAAPTPSAAVAAASAPVVAASAPAGSVLSRLPVELLVEGMQFVNGRVDFNDRFVRPNFRADLTELNGQVGRLDSRSRDMATLQFNGRVAGTGLLDIGGALNPTVLPPALDLKAKATDIELAGLTPYSSKYAGYPIERGKLSVDVAYKIEADGKLDASNQIIVNQLTFGAKVDSPQATKLPVPLIVALLQDRHGVIDLDLPLSGSVNDPQFDMWALIWKVVANFFGKVLTSPFSALGGSGGKDLSHVEFIPGTATLAEPSREVVAKVAKALDDRPGLKLAIAASADPQTERDAMQRAEFEARLLEEQRRTQARGALGRSGDEAPLPPPTPEQRQQLVRQLYADTRLPDKPRNLIGMAKDIPLPEMEAMLVAAMPADAAAARRLAAQRGLTVRDALIAKGLGSERIFLGEPKVRDAAPDNAPWVPQAQLALSAK